MGPAGSLATLRNLGYRTFDHAIDNSYDLETNNIKYEIVEEELIVIKTKDPEIIEEIEEALKKLHKFNS